MLSAMERVLGSASECVMVCGAVLGSMLSMFLSSLKNQLLKSSS